MENKPEKKVYGKYQAAEYLSISRARFQKIIENNEIPYVIKNDTQFVFIIDDLLEYLNKRSERSITSPTPKIEFIQMFD